MKNEPAMKPKIILCLALVLSGTLFAVEPKNIDQKTVDGLWPELWKMGASPVEAPTVVLLSEEQVIKEMASDWKVTYGPNHLVISLKTNETVIIRTTNLANWEKQGSWRVISGKLILFMRDDSLPLFIFRVNDKTYIYNPFAKAMMSEIRQSNDLTQNNLPPLDLEPVLAMDRKISEGQILKFLNAMDAASANRNAAAFVANFASNAVITGTVVGKKRTDTNTDDIASYRQKLESGFKNLDDLADYKVQRKDVKIQITFDGHNATSRSTLIETYEWNGNPGRSNTKESDIFEVIDGKILLAKMDMITTTE